MNDTACTLNMLSQTAWFATVHALGIIYQPGSAQTYWGRDWLTNDSRPTGLGTTPHRLSSWIYGRGLWDKKVTHKEEIE